MKLFINYASGKFYVSQKESCLAAKNNGFDEVIPYNEKDLDEEFVSKHYQILKQPRGAGYWLWKPYLIVKTLRDLKDGDYLCYSDSGCAFVNDVRWLIDDLEKSGQDIMPFDLQNQIERKWTKRDVFIYNKCDTPEITDTNICDASIQVIKKSDSSVKFYDEYLSQSCLENLITDCSNAYGVPNYPEFIDHRHDQSIYSVNVKKNGLITFRAPSQYGNGFEKLYKYSNYPQVIDHHRNPL